MTQIRLHCPKVAVVDPQANMLWVLLSPSQCSRQLVLIVNFQQDVESEIESFANQISQGLAREAFRDKQDGIGSGPTSFVQLPGIHDKVFSKHWDRNFGLHGF